MITMGLTLSDVIDAMLEIYEEHGDIPVEYIDQFERDKPIVRILLYSHNGINKLLLEGITA